MLIAFVLPVVLLLLFAYAVSLDVREGCPHVGVVLESRWWHPRTRWPQRSPAPAT
jgi:hypothetical protein